MDQVFATMDQVFVTMDQVFATMDQVFAVMDQVFGILLQTFNTNFWHLYPKPLDLEFYYLPTTPQLPTHRDGLPELLLLDFLAVELFLNISLFADEADVFLPQIPVDVLQLRELLLIGLGDLWAKTKVTVKVV